MSDRTNRASARPTARVATDKRSAASPTSSASAAAAATLLAEPGLQRSVSGGAAIVPPIAMTRPRSATRSVSTSQVPLSNCRSTATPLKSSSKPDKAADDGDAAKTGKLYTLYTQDDLSQAAGASPSTSSSSSSTRSTQPSSSTASDEKASLSSSGFFSASRYSTMIESDPPLPPDSTISAEDVIRESLASSRGTSVSSDQDDLRSSRFSDLLTGSFSHRGTFRRSTISEQMLRESELFEPERELSMREMSEVLGVNGTAGLVKPMPMTSIKEEEQDVKMEAARSRWAQHVKLRARNFLFNGMGVAGLKASVAPAPQANTQNGVSAATQEWALKQKALLAQQQPNDTLPPMINTVLGSAPGAAKLQKWNRWMQDYFTNGQAVPVPDHDPTGLISLEEVVSNPRMMRYYAAWLQDAADQSKLFFLCSFEEYRQFWCTLRANYKASAKQPSSSSTSSTSILYSKDDILLLRTYGVKIATKYLTKGAQFHIASDVVDSESLHKIKRDIAAGGEDALRTFDSLVTRVKRALMMRFPDFRKTELYSEMQKSVEREVVNLEDILMNQRFANFFLVFLFPHNYHREIAFWLDVEYEFKPVFRAYTAVLKTQGRRKETKEVASRQCKKLIRYICEKYYPGDHEMKKLDKSVSGAFARLQQEQDVIFAKFNLIHVELYHRFLMSRAYTEFALYPNGPEEEESMDDLRRLSGLLLSYGLRVHHWPEEASRDALRKRSLEVLATTRGYEAICGVLSFDAACDADQAAAGTAALKILQSPLPHDPNPAAMDRSIESFLLPWCSDLENVVVHASTCPPPVAFNFKMGDSSSSNELYAACVVMYKPAPPLPPSFFEKVRIDTSAGSGLRWVPYGMCILSKFALVDLLRERLAEGYEFLLELESIAARQKASSGAKASSASSPDVFQLDKKVLSKLSRSVSLGESASTAVVSSSSPAGSLPRLDHSIRLLFDTLDVATVVQVFASVLLESRVLFVSSHLSVLMRVCEAMRALMFPLLWPHVYLPVLPRRMLQYLDCPTPFIFGVTKASLEEATRADLISSDVVIVDLDKGCIVQGDTAPLALPSTVLHSLRDGLYECLKPNVSRSDHVFAHRFPTHPHAFPDVAVRRLFYQTVQKLIGEFGYHRYTWTDEFSKKKIVFFDEASYLAASTPESRDFRTQFAATQAFSEFVVSFNGFEDAGDASKKSEADTSRSEN